ncbi:hypothetical protein DSO57_1000110 [Entomophthora muscae]|uniref:Uncharacterized protein n=1 Tax=Entomophthora muscae TaxID=34485 RepID=A0ACC2SMC6_9FUNG|nr:hypothetical protein DSO57_1000110 [Entomophthora muscae]
MFIFVFIGAALSGNGDFIVDRAKLRWFPCEQPMSLDPAIKWTGSPMSFRDYHVAERREKQSITSYNGFFKEHIFAKEKETYWFGQKEKVSDILQCDIRYNCTLRTSYFLHRSVYTTSTKEHNFEEWRKITKPNPPHPEALTDVAFMSTSNELNFTEKAPRYIWFNPVMWGVRGTYVVKYKFGFTLYSTTEEIEVYFPLKLPSGQLNGIYGLGKAHYERDEWRFY